ncbi:MAG: hypothetical protein WEB00_09730 [Dehalococcoidia bacterium]
MNSEPPKPIDEDEPEPIEADSTDSLDDTDERSTWLVAGAIVLVVAIIAGIGALGIFVLGDTDTDDADIAVTIRDYLTAFEDKDSAEACDLESEGFQRSQEEGQSCEEFYDGLLAGFDELEYEDVGISEIEFEDDTGSALVSYRRITDGEELDCEDIGYAMAKEDGDWKVAGRGTCVPPEDAEGEPTEEPEDDEESLSPTADE